MPTHTSHREAITRTLTYHAGAGADASTIAEVTLDTWRQMVARLAPIIGVGGVDVLFRRSLRLTSTSFPWIAADSQGSAALLPGLQARLADREADVAAAAAQALLVTFYELLGSMMGEALTGRLLASVWTPLSVTPTTENAR